MRAPLDRSLVIEEMVRRIVETCRPQTIILFGSSATGEAAPDSDVDLLVVVPFEGRRMTMAVSLLRRLAGIGLPKDVIVLKPEEYDSDKEIPGTIAWPAARTGRVLYAA